MTDYLKAMVDEALEYIDSLSIDELENELKSFGIEVTRKQLILIQ